MMKFDPAWRPTRRDILASTVGAVAAGAAVLLPAGGWVPLGRDRLRLGLIGCGGRGTGAARQAAAADSRVQIVAMGDVFEDHVAESASLLARDIGHQFECASSGRFVGQDAWQRVLDAGIDAVILAATPWSRPVHLREAVARGLHVYAERPGAADLPGLHAAVTACDEARARGVVVVSGLAGRHHRPTIDTIHRIRNGALGWLHHATVRAHVGLPWYRPRRHDTTADDHRLRNWVRDRALSGGPLLERHLDAIDRGLQVFGDACPVSARPADDGAGASVCFRFATGAELVAEIVRATHERTAIDERVWGSAGTADLVAHRIEGRSPWTHAGPNPDPWQQCMAGFIHSIMAGTPGDGGIPLCRSTLVALLGRTALDEGREVALEELVGMSARMTGIIGSVLDAGHRA